MSVAVSQPGYEVAEGTLPDHEQLLVRLWREGGLGSEPNEQVDLNRLRWFYRQNPQGIAQVNLLTYGLNNEPVGCLGITPRKFFVGVESVYAGTLVDFVVTPKHRSAFPALMLQRTGRHRALQAWEFVYGLPDTKAVAICKRLPSHVRLNLPCFVRIVRSRTYLERIVPKPLASALAWFADGADRLVTSLRLCASRNRGEWLSKLDDRFDALWVQFNKQKFCIGLRDRAFLQWRFEAQPQHKYQVFAVSTRAANDLRMYFMCECSEQGITVKDCLNVGSETELQQGLLLLITAARKLNVNSIDLQLAADNTWRRALKRTHFALRSSRPFFAAFREPLQKKVAGLEWYITPADEDI